LNGWMTQEQLVEETYLPQRTVKYAIRNLREYKAIQEKPNLDDLRRKYFRYKGQNLHS
jgi:DNA-binding MarR family transcriptional regulator